MELDPDQPVLAGADGPAMTSGGGADPGREARPRRARKPRTVPARIQRRVAQPRTGKRVRADRRTVRAESPGPPRDLNRGTEPAENRSVQADLSQVSNPDEARDAMLGDGGLVAGARSSGHQEQGPKDGLVASAGLDAGGRSVDLDDDAVGFGDAPVELPAASWRGSKTRSRQTIPCWRWAKARRPPRTTKLFPACARRAKGS